MDLADDGQHARSTAARARQPGGGVEQARPGNNAHRRRATGGLRRTHRHVRATLFVTGDDHFQPVAGIDDRIEERVVLHPGQAEQLADAVRLHAIEDVLSDGPVSVSGHRVIVTTVHRHDRTNRSEP